MIYDRSNSVADAVVDSSENLEELKSVQVIGNDNLIITHYQEVYGSSTFSSAVFKATFTFDQPSTSLVLFSFFWDTTASFNYELSYYDDPATVNDTTKKSYIMDMDISSGTATIDNITAIADSTQTGTLIIQKL